MSDKKLTDEEIIKVLECCAYNDGCERCQYSKQCDGAEHLINTLDLINRQKAEIERLKSELSNTRRKALLEASSKFAGHSNYHGDTILCKLICMAEGQEVGIAIPLDMSEMKANAYKEFAEKLQAFCKGIIAQKWNEKAAPISWSCAYADFIDDIDNLLKEMVGEEE